MDKIDWIDLIKRFGYNIVKSSSGYKSISYNVIVGGSLSAEEMSIVIDDPNKDNVYKLNIKVIGKNNPNSQYIVKFKEKLIASDLRVINIDGIPNIILVSF